MNLISPAYEICTFFVNRTYLKKGRPAQNETQYTHTTPIRAPLFVNFYVKGGGR